MSSASKTQSETSNVGLRLTFDKSSVGNSVIAHDFSYPSRISGSSGSGLSSPDEELLDEVLLDELDELLFPVEPELPEF